jgi:hypothetical protein
MRFPTYLKLGLALVLLPATAMAGTVSLSNTNKKAEKRWTAERYAAARPLPMIRSPPPRRRNPSIAALPRRAGRQSPESAPTRRTGCSIPRTG